MTRVARTSGPSMGPLHVQLYTERLPTLLRCSGHQETSGSNAAASALKSGGIASTLLDVAMISCDQKRGGDGVTFREREQVADMAWPSSLVPLPASFAGGAGARPDHPISGHQATLAVGLRIWAEARLLRVRSICAFSSKKRSELRIGTMF